MASQETLRDFYTGHGQDFSKAGQFNVFERGGFACSATSMLPNRRDFYKISLIQKGSGMIGVADKVMDIRDNALLFMNPLVPFSWEPTEEEQTGYFCLFTEEFVTQNLKSESLTHSSLFKAGGNHIFFPEAGSMALLSTVFQHMLREMQSDYANKYELLRSYIQIIMHEAMKIQPAAAFYKPLNAAERIAGLFLELLERQFPIDAPDQVVPLRNANEYAAQLNVHTNTLNRALKETTGKTTTSWIAARYIKEAKALLQHSNWDMAEIAYCLGFEHAANFNIFFKKHTATSPLQYRKDLV